MYKWFECKVKYDKQAEDGSFKPESEIYMIDAQSFTEAETRITLEMKPYISGEFEVLNIKRVKITEIFNMHDDSADRWYKSKVNLIIPDEEKGIEKKVGNIMFVKASNMQSAVDNLIKGMSTSLTDYEIANIAETMIMDFYEYAEISTTPTSMGENPFDAIANLGSNSTETQKKEL